jgi:hypothetical protein
MSIPLDDGKPFPIEETRTMLPVSNPDKVMLEPLGLLTVSLIPVHVGLGVLEMPHTRTHHML